MNCATATRATLATLVLVTSVFCLASADAQEPASTVDPSFQKALHELKEGRDVDANVAKLRNFVDHATGADATATARDVGVLLLREGNYESAQGFFEVARARSPKDGTSAQLLGLAFVMQNRFAEGLGALDAAGKLLPPGPRPLHWQYVSMALCGLQRVEEAEKAAKRAVDEARQWNAAPPPGQKAVDVFDFELNLETIYQRTRRFDAALAVLDRLPAEQLTQRDQVKAWLARAQLLDAKGDDAGALAAFRKRVEIAPDLAESWYQFALFHVSRGDPVSARPLLEKATALAPDHEGAHFNLARVLTRLGEKDAGTFTMQRYARLRDARIAGEVRLAELRNRLLATSGSPNRRR